MAEHDFKVLEEELELWFDEQNDQLSQQYLKVADVTKAEEERQNQKNKKGFFSFLNKKGNSAKPMNPIRPKDGKDSKGSKPADPDAERRAAEQKFLAARKAIRDEYERRYNKIRDAQDKKEGGEKEKKRVVTPIKKSLSEFFRPIKISFTRWKGETQEKITITKARNATAMANFKHKLGNFYLFKARPVVKPVASPIQRGVDNSLKPVRKDLAKFKEWRKKTISETTKKITKAIDVTMKFFKKWIDIYKKQMAKVSAFFGKIFGKISEVLNKLFDKYIKPYLPKKKEEEE